MKLREQLYCGQVEDLICYVPDNSIDLIVTSPPYAGKREDVYTVAQYDEYVKWLYALSKQFMRVLKPSGSFVLNIKDGVRDGHKETYVMEYVLKMAKDGWHRDTYVWNKTNPYPCGGKRHLKDGFEYCFHFAKQNDYCFYPEHCLVPANPKWLKDNLRRSNKGAHNVTNKSGLNMKARTCNAMVRPSNVITLPVNTTNTKHPATFPVGLPTFFIKLMSKPGDLVLDPFMGSGTTAVACVLEKRDYLGFDDKPEYIEMAQQRLMHEETERTATIAEMVGGTGGLFA